MSCKQTKSIEAVDLFCGAGGLTKGLENAGIKVKFGVDIDSVCEYPYNSNNKADFLLKPIENLKAADLKNMFSDDCIRLLAGCAPCQTFSTYNQKAKRRDSRWFLLRHFTVLVSQVLPDLVTMENVPKIKEHWVFQEFIETLESLNYRIDCKVVNCSDYGLPQHRPRLVMLGSKLGPIELLSGKQLRWKTYTVRDTIGSLPPLAAGEKDEKDPFHQACSLSDLNLQRIKTSRPGGTWRDWDKSLVSDCHRRATGKTYVGVYGRMSWDEPAPTITTQFYGFGNGRFGHPDQDRAISLREGAMLQSFPKGYKFVPPGKQISKKAVGRLIGNAVPVKLAKAIGKSFVRHIESLSQ